MSQLGSHEVVFHDASSCFSEEEWALLQEWQKDLYRNVMKEIHQALISLGPLITSTVVSLRTKDTLELCSTDAQNSNRRLGISNSPKGGTIASPGVFGKIHSNEAIHLKYPPDTVERARNMSPNSGSEFGENGPGLNTEEPRVVLIDHLGAEVGEIGNSPNAGPAFGENGLGLTTEEPRVVLIDDMGAEAGEASNSPDADFPVVTAVYSLRYTGEGVQYSYVPVEPSADIVSVTIKDEEEVYPMGHQDSEQMENSSAETGGEMMNGAEQVRYSSKRSANTAVAQGSQMETNSTSQDWSLRGAGSLQCGSSFSNAAPVNFPEASTATEASDSDCDSNVSNSYIQNYLSRREQMQNQLKFSERNNSRAGEPGDNKVTHERERKHPCTKCDKRFFSRSNLNEHYRVHDRQRKYACSECNHRFMSKRQLIVHQNRHLRERNSQTGERSGQIGAPTRERKYPCTKCEKRFFSKSNLNEHYRTHDGDRSHQCSECGHCFVSRGQLIAHQIRHFRARNSQTGEGSDQTEAPERERKYPCTKCEKRFFSKSNLNEHYRIHEGERTHQCSECGHCYFSKSQLLAHQKTHSRERTHVCDICDKRFFAKSHLAEHYTMHTGKKRYQCPFCYKGFNKRHNLEGHIRTHTGEKPYLCVECGKEFTWKSGCLKHQKVCHGI